MEELFQATLKATAELRQKDPLSHRRRRRQRPQNPMGGGLNIHEEMKGMLGKLGPEDLKKADKMWKMLDNMYENDPVEYQKFIETQMKLGEEHKQQEAAKNNTKSGGSNTSSFNSTKGDNNAGVRSTNKRTFTPEGCFVVKAYGRYLKNKIFLNMCCHKGVQRPMGTSGKVVEDNTQPHLARQIPLLVGAPREVKDVKGIECTAIDVVFNPWVTSKAENNTMFKSQVVDLAMKWITNDYPDIKFDTRWKTPNSKYKGGGGRKGNEPLPFPVELAMNQGNSEGGNKSAEEKSSGSSSSSSTPPAPSVDPLSSPASLLAETRKSEDTSSRSINASKSSDGAAAAMMNIKGATATEKSKTKSLIQEMDKDGNVVDKKKKTQTKKNAKKAVKKGFLNSGKEINLYGPEGSNEDGFVTGRPKKGSLLDRCKVVDTRSMSQETLDKTMKEYAETGTTTAPGRAPRTKPKVQTKPKASNGNNNMTEVKNPTKAKTAKTSNKMKNKPTQQQEDEFDRLMAKADPEALSDAMTNVLNSSGSNGLEGLGLSGSDVDMMQKLLFGENGGKMDSANKSGMNSMGKDVADMMKHAMEAKKEEETKEPSTIDAASVPGLKGSFNLPKLKYTMETTKNKKNVDLIKIVVQCPSIINDFSKMELDVSDTTMKLKIENNIVQPLTIQFKNKCLSTQAKAKFKKNKSLVVSIPIAAV